MKYITDIVDFKNEKKMAVTIGKFDGVHKGHFKLIRKVLGKKTIGMGSMMFTFTMPPAEFFDKKVSMMIQTIEERRIYVENLGLDYLIEYQFNKEFASMEADWFIREILINKLNVGYIAVGNDFRFGHERKGDCRLLQKYGAKYGFTVEVVEKEVYELQEISSSLIRREIFLGNIEKTNFLLGHPFSIIGEVLQCWYSGDEHCFFSLNLAQQYRKLLPPKGIYVSRTIIDGKSYFGVTKISERLTPSNGAGKGVETYIFDYEGVFDKKIIEVQLIKRELKKARIEVFEDLRERLENNNLVEV